MKITLNNPVKNYADLRHYAKDNAASYAASNKGHNFDAITIQSNRRQIEERTFAESVARKLSSEVSKTASDEKLQNLRDQVTSHSYRVDTHAVASKILLVQEDM